MARFIVLSHKKNQQLNYNNIYTIEWWVAYIRLFVTDLIKLCHTNLLKLNLLN